MNNDKDQNSNFVNKETDHNQDIANMSYESAKVELEKVVANLERGNLTLDESLALWERGQMLGKRCSAHLSAAADRIRDGETDKESVSLKECGQSGDVAQS